jgi:hypothetical protein
MKKISTPKSSLFGFGLRSEPKTEQKTIEHKKTAKPQEPPKPLEEKLPKGFKSKLIEMEFQLEKGPVT